MKLMVSFIATLFASSSRRWTATTRAPLASLVKNTRPLTTKTAPLTSRHTTTPPRHFAVATILAATLSAAATTTTVVCATADDGNFDKDAVVFDSYNGVILHVTNLTSLDNFSGRLKDELAHYKSHGKRGVWIHCPTEHAHVVVPASTQLGFDFHSAQTGMVVLKRWLSSDTASRLPNGPTHQVGIGAIVLDKEGKMLVVQEKSGPAAQFKLWKMPTGLLDPGEDIADAAKRELQEETGLKGSLQKILCFRQAHAGGDRGSDLFFVCLMQLDDTDVENKLKPQEEEIAAISYMDIDEFCAQETWQRSPVYLELNAAMVKAIREESAGMHHQVLPVGFRPGFNTIYIPPKAAASSSGSKL